MSRLFQHYIDKAETRWKEMNKKEKLKWEKIGKKKVKMLNKKKKLTIWKTDNIHGDR